MVHSYCRKWRLKANVSKSTVMTFGKGSVKGSWKWGEQDLPRVSKYRYLEMYFAESGVWDVHIKKVVASGKKKVNQLHSVISNRDINLSARRLLLLAVVRPTPEYGSEVRQGLVMRPSGGIWDWNLYRVVAGLSSLTNCPCDTRIQPHTHAHTQ